jgi:ligand-binding SRPBCC domain-containing protein
MAIVRVETDVAAPPAVCFDLARSVDAHLASAAATGERAIAGVTTGLLALGDEVTWRARHLGVVQDLTSRITVLDRPRHFRDEMVRGAFRSFVHDHYFQSLVQTTRVVDVVEFQAPAGLLGRLVERVVLHAYLTRFLRTRAAALKHLAETDGWRRYVKAG